MKKALVVTATVVLAGCGSSAKRTDGPPPPRLPRTLAQDFARRSDEIAQRLDAGDPCGALDAATKLQHRSISLIGRVPREYQETLQGTINHIVVRISCTQQPPVTPTLEDKHEQEHEKGRKHKDKHKRKHGDEQG